MALSPKVWYSSYEKTSAYFGFSPIQDQQLAGYIMWMPAGVTFVVIAVALQFKVIKETAPYQESSE